MPWLALLAPLASLAFPVPPRPLAFLALRPPLVHLAHRLHLALRPPLVHLALLQVTKTNKEGVRKSAFLVGLGGF